MAKPAIIPAFLASLWLISAAAPAFAETVQIDVDKMLFTPEKISVHVGDKVEWINHDIVKHNITTKNGLVSIDLPVKGKVSIGMAKEGPFEYYCKYHPNMKGVIEVVK